ncbi:MAG: hypothetical protein ACP5GD_03340 [Candidatus Micrarchaeia archaeon]|jgi:hypothetical protein
MKSVDEITYKTVANGGILAKLYFDMQSEKQEDLQPLMLDLVNNRLLKTPGVVYCYGSIEEPIKLPEGVYSTSATLTVLFKNAVALLDVAFKFAPAGIEILKPEKEYRISISDLQAIVLNAAQVSIDYSQYILSKVLSKEDLAKVQLELKQREELGKRLMGKSKQEEGKDQG